MAIALATLLAPWLTDHPQRVWIAALVAGGELRPIPSGTLLGVPADPSSVDGFTFEPHDEDTGAPLLAAGTDIAVGELVARRFGSDVVRRLVDPLLGSLGETFRHLLAQAS